MNKKSMMFWSVLLLGVLMLAGTITGIVTAAPPTADDDPAASTSAQTGGEVDVCDEYTEFQDFLDENYDIDLGEEKVISQVQFLDAAEDIFGEEGAAVIPDDIDDSGFSMLESVFSAVYIANIDELALTYQNEKIDKTLEYWVNVPEDLTIERKQELAAAVGSGLLGENWNGIDFEEDVSSEFATELLGKMLLHTGKYKHFAGYLSDADISSKILYIWNSFDQVSAPDFQDESDEMIKEGLITGYNIKRSANRPLFDRERTVVYGHSSIEHAIQLINLMVSEDMEARVLLEPKTSAYLYMKDWGEPTESPEFQVEALPDGNYIAYAKEYDLAFEFEDEDYMVDFDELVKQYAKKNEEDQQGLIIDSWWQPLYSSETAVDGYTQVVNNVVQQDGFFIQSFSMVEDSPSIIQEFKKQYPKSETDVINLWVNQAFYNYLGGESQ